MEDRLLRRQQREVKEMKRVKGIERYKHMRSDTVDISSEYPKEIGTSQGKKAFNYGSKERMSSSKSETSHAW
jgi:hypothetical protein